MGGSFQRRYSATSSSGIRLASFFFSVIGIYTTSVLQHFLATTAQDNFAGISHAASNRKNFFFRRFHRRQTHRSSHFQIIAQQLGHPLGHVAENLILQFGIPTFDRDI